MRCSSCGKYVDNAAVRHGKRTVCPKCGNQLDPPPPPNKAAGILRVHWVLMVVGIILLFTGIVLTIKLDQSGQSLASGLIGLAILVAVGDFFVWRAYKKEAAKGVKPKTDVASIPFVPPTKTGEAELKRKKGKRLKALVVIGAVLIVVVTSIVIWAVDNKDTAQKSDYATKAKELLETRTVLLAEERDAATAFGKETKQIATYTDLTLIQTGKSRLAAKYIPIYQGYYDRLKSTKDEFGLMKPPSEFKQSHDLYLKSCDSFCKSFVAMMDALRLLPNVNESTESQITSLSAAIDRYSNEGTDLTNQAQQAWPE